MPDEPTDQRIGLVREYFRKVDARDPGLLDMYTDDVQLYFPKFGLGHGKSAMADFAERLGSDLEWLEHDIDKIGRASCRKECSSRERQNQVQAIEEMNDM